MSTQLLLSSFVHVLIHGIIARNLPERVDGSGFGQLSRYEKPADQKVLRLRATFRLLRLEARLATRVINIIHRSTAIRSVLRVRMLVFPVRAQPNQSTYPFTPQSPIGELWADDHTAQISCSRRDPSSSSPLAAGGKRTWLQFFCALSFALPERPTSIFPTSSSPSVSAFMQFNTASVSLKRFTCFLEF